MGTSLVLRFVGAVDFSPEPNRPQPSTARVSGRGARWHCKKPDPLSFAARTAIGDRTPIVERSADHLAAARCRLGRPVAGSIYGDTVTWRTSRPWGYRRCAVPGARSLTAPPAGRIQRRLPVL